MCVTTEHTHQKCRQLAPEIQTSSDLESRTSDTVRIDAPKERANPPHDYGAESMSEKLLPDVASGRVSYQQSP